MKINNCVAGDYAIVIRRCLAAAPGTIVKVNFSSRQMTDLHGLKMWDVEASGGRFFYAADEDLAALTPAYAPSPGCRDELFDAVWIYSDAVEGHCRYDQIGLTKKQTQSRRSR